MFANLFANFGQKSQKFIVITHVFRVKMPKKALVTKKLAKIGLSCSLFSQEIGLSSANLLKIWTRAQNRSLLIVRY